MVPTNDPCRLRKVLSTETKDRIHSEERPSALSALCIFIEENLRGQIVSSLEQDSLPASGLLMLHCLRGVPNIPDPYVIKY